VVGQACSSSKTCGELPTSLRFEAARVPLFMLCCVCSKVFMELEARWLAAEQEGGVGLPHTAAPEWIESWGVVARRDQHRHLWLRAGRQRILGA
jgi:hypothetical protein